MLDEIAAATEIVTDDAMSLTAFLYEEAEATMEFLLEAAARMESVLARATSSVMGVLGRQRLKGSGGFVMLTASGSFPFASLEGQDDGERQSRFPSGMTNKVRE